MIGYESIGSGTLAPKHLRAGEMRVEKMLIEMNYNRMWIDEVAKYVSSCKGAKIVKVAPLSIDVKLLHTEEWQYQVAVQSRDYDVGGKPDRVWIGEQAQVTQFAIMLAAAIIETGHAVDLVLPLSEFSQIHKSEVEIDEDEDEEEEDYNGDE